MVTKKKARLKVKKLKLNKETVKDLTGAKQKNIKGGLTYSCQLACQPQSAVGNQGTGNIGQKAVSITMCSCVLK